MDSPLRFLIFFSRFLRTQLSVVFSTCVILGAHRILRVVLAPTQSCGSWANAFVARASVPWSDGNEADKYCHDNGGSQRLPNPEAFGDKCLFSH